MLRMISIACPAKCLPPVFADMHYSALALLNFALKASRMCVSTFDYDFRPKLQAYGKVGVATAASCRVATATIVTLKSELSSSDSYI